MVKRTNAYKKARVDDIEWVVQQVRETEREMVERRKKLIESKKTGERMVYCIVTNDLIFPSFWQTGIVNLFSVFTCHNYNIHGRSRPLGRMLLAHRSNKFQSHTYEYYRV